MTIKRFADDELRAMSDAELKAMGLVRVRRVADLTDEEKRTRKEAWVERAWVERGLDIAIRLEAMGLAWEGSKSEDERIRHLLGALVLCDSFRPLPDWASVALCKLLAARLPREPGMHEGRWMLVKEGRRQGLTWEKAYEHASDRVGGSADVAKKSYQLVERDRRAGRRPLGKK